MWACFGFVRHGSAGAKQFLGARNSGPRDFDCRGTRGACCNPQGNGTQSDWVQGQPLDINFQAGVAPILITGGSTDSM